MFPTLIQFGDFRLASYGVCVALAYLIGFLWFQSQRYRMGLTDEQCWSLIYCVFLGAILGGKLLFAILEWRRFASGEMRLIQDFRYGFVYYGGVLGGTLLAWAYARGKFLACADYAGVAMPLGHWMGRLGCLAAGCCYGKPTALPWGIEFDNPASLVEPGLLGIPLHPTQLYEAAASLAIAGGLYRVLGEVERGRLRRGTVFYAYLILYSLARFSIEFFRGDDRGGFWIGLAPSQWISLCVLSIVFVLAWRNGIWTRPSRT